MFQEMRIQCKMINLLQFFTMLHFFLFTAYIAHTLKWQKISLDVKLQLISASSGLLMVA